MPDRHTRPYSTAPRPEGRGKDGRGLVRNEVEYRSEAKPRTAWPEARGAAQTVIVSIIVNIYFKMLVPTTVYIVGFVFENGMLNY